MDQPATFARTPAFVWAAALAIPTLATLAAMALDGPMSVAGLSMVYMAAVATSAATLPRAPAAASALLAVVSLNFFFVPPRGSLAVDGAEYWWILLALLALSLGLGAIMGSLRARRAEAELGRERASELHRLSESMSEAEGLDAMALAAAAFLGKSTGRPSAIFVRDEDGALVRFAHPDEAEFDERAAAWTIQTGKPMGAGSLDWPDTALWCAPFARLGARGAAQFSMPPRERVTPDVAEHWLALTRQAGLAIERESASSAAAKAEQNAKAESVRNTLLASLSHDLRTPLAGIVGSASALRSQGAQMNAEQRERLLENLEGEARDLALMADNILQVARLSQPQSQLTLQWESIEDVLGAAVARMRRRWPEASIALKAPAGLPPVRAEAGLLAQAVANLVDNAVRHGGAPPRVVVQAGRGRDGVFVAVRDFGEGLPEADLSTLFERWRRGERGRADGSGLGLAICRLVAEAHGGSIAGKRCDPGSEFRIDLPASDLPTEAA